MSDIDIPPASRPPPPAVFAVRGEQRVVVTWILLALNIAMFAWTLSRGASLMSPTTRDLLDVGANQAALVAHGQWWRLFTCMFVHVGLIHVFVNMFSLRAVGPTVERLFGHFGFLWLYLLSGIGASIASCLYNPGPASAGASGALFGIIGGLAAFVLTHRREMPVALFRRQIQSILFVIGINVMIGLSVPMVDNSAHFGGLATGFVAGLCLYRESRVPPELTLWHGLRLALLALVLVAAAMLIPLRVAAHPRVGAAMWIEQSEEAGDRGDWIAMRDFATRAIEAAPNTAEAYELRAVALFNEGSWSAALRDAYAAIDLNPELPMARRVRGSLLFQRREHEKALDDLNRCVASDDAQAWPILKRGHVLFSLARFDAALRDFQSAAKLDQDHTVEPQVYAWLCRARLGLADEARRQLVDWHADLGLDAREPWIDVLVDFATGKASEAEFLAKLPKLKSDEGVDLGLRARFVAGEMRAARGDFEGAKLIWTSAVNVLDDDLGQPVDAIHARDELGRLAAKPLR